MSVLTREQRASGHMFIHNTGDRAWKRWMEDMEDTCDALEKIAEAAVNVRTSWIGTKDITSTEEQALLDALASYENARFSDRKEEV